MNFFEKIESKYLVAPKIVYLLVNLHFYGFHQLRFAFAKDKFGINDEDYGKFTGYTQFITFFTNILIGGLADRTKKYKPMMIGLVILSTVVFMSFYIEQLARMDMIVFWLLMLAYLASNNPKQPLLDKIMIEYLENFSALGPKSYGKQRLWGTLSLSLATYLCEWSITNKDGSFDFKYLIHYNLIATVLAAICVMLLIRSRRSNNENNKETTAIQNIENTSQQSNNSISNNEFNVTGQQPAQEQQNNRKYVAFLELFKNKEFMFFILVIFSNAVTRSALTIYLSIFHKEILKIKPYTIPSNIPAFPKSLLSFLNNKPIATLTTFGIVFEMLVMFVADKIIDKMGYFWPLIIAQIVSTIRFMSYYLISSSNEHVYGLSCIFELLRGIYFGMIHISSVHIAPKLAPKHLTATSQMMYQGTFSALGSLVSGYLFGDMFKSKLSDVSSDQERERIFKQIFLINTIISLATIIVCFIKYGLIDRVLFSREAEEKKLNSYEMIEQSVE